MKALACFLLLPLLTSSLENVPLSKRELDHRSNIALLNNINFQTGKPAEIIPIPSPTPSIVNVENPTQGTIPVTINTESLALGNPNPIQREAQFTYAPSFQQNLPLLNPQQLENNIVYLTGDRSQPSAFQFTNVFPPVNPGLPLVAATNTNFQNGAVNNIQDNRNLIQTYVPQNLVEVPQQYPVQLIREVKVPQPYPVHITRTVQVPVHIRVPVEVPKPYAVKVPHPVPVPVHIRIPVPVDRPYPVQITKTVAVPVEKPVYIKVPQPIQVPVPQPYPVGVPQPVQVQVPFVVRLPDVPQPNPTPDQPTVAPDVPPIDIRFGNVPQETAPFGAGAASQVGSNFEIIPAPEVSSLINNHVSLPIPLASETPSPPDLNPIDGPTTECSSCKEKSTESTTLTTSQKPLLSLSGNGLLPPHLPSSLSSTSKPERGLLNSYVSSKDGGVYRRSTEYQTNEYQKTW